MCQFKQIWNCSYCWFANLYLVVLEFCVLAQIRTWKSQLKRWCPLLSLKLPKVIFIGLIRLWTSLLPSKKPRIMIKIIAFGLKEEPMTQTVWRKHPRNIILKIPNRLMRMPSMMPARIQIKNQLVWHILNLFKNIKKTKAKRNWNDRRKILSAAEFGNK